ncbi:hypothetical protein VNI00_003061 [Paramarasmius palmivorus]|uniref:Protein kinase domain-containing protein n=1 Tax=Paramarasmius palmivorus TaxID=297713 RepID=A0AAW0DXG6_9AGAR
MATIPKRVNLKCYVFTHRPIERYQFPITISSDDSLETVIRQVRSNDETASISGRVILYKAIDLYVQPKSNIHERVQAWLEEHLEEPLDSVDSGLVGEVWPDGGDWSSPRKFDVVAVDESGLNRLTTIRALIDPALRPRLSLIDKHDLEISRFPTAPNPSAGASDPSTCYTGLVDVRGGRPAAAYGPSNALFDPHLARLTHELRNLDTVPVTSGMINSAYRLLTASADFYQIEDYRVEVIRLTLDNLFPDGRWHEYIASTGAKPTAFWLLSLIFEFKYENGAGGDPMAQAILDYITLLSDEGRTGHFRRRSNCPSILLYLAGTQLHVSTAVFTDAVHVEALYSENLHGGSDFDDRLLRLARALQAVKTAFDGLSTFYAELEQAAPPLDGTHLLPRPVQASAPHAEVADSLGLRFLYKLSRVGDEIGDSKAERDQNTSHAVYVALSSGPSIPAGQVIVKFAMRYNVEAHKLLANAGLAPKLYHHVPVLGGYTMIVMERVVGTLAWVWQRKGDGRLRLLPHAVYEAIEQAIGLLHDQDIVFGDLRPPNIIVLEDESSAVLIDFDWAAKAREGRYPASIHLGSLFDDWAPGVERYGLMEKEHDLHMLRDLKKACEQG